MIFSCKSMTIRPSNRLREAASRARWAAGQAAKCRCAAVKPLSIRSGRRRTGCTWEYDRGWPTVSGGVELSDPGQGPGDFLPRDRPVVTHFSLGGLGAVPLRKTIDVPYFPGKCIISARRASSSAAVWTGPFPTLRSVRKARQSTSRRPTARGTGYGKSAMWPSRRIWARCCRTSRIRRRPIASCSGRGSCSISGDITRHVPGRRREPAGLEGQRHRPPGDHLARLAALRLRRETARSSAGQSAFRRRRRDDRLWPRGQRLRLHLVAARELYRPVPRRPFLRSVGPRAAKRRLAVEGLVQPGDARCRASG